MSRSNTWSKNKPTKNNNKKIFKHEDVNNNIQKYLLNKGNNIDINEFVNFLTINYTNIDEQINSETKNFITNLIKIKIHVEFETFNHNNIQSLFDSFMNNYYEFKKDESELNLNNLEISFYELFENSIDFFSFFELERDNYEFLVNKINNIQKQYNKFKNKYNNMVNFLLGLFDAAKTFAIYNLIRYTPQYNNFKNVLIYFYQNDILPRIHVTTSEWSMWNALWYYPESQECDGVTKYFDFYCDFFHSKNINIFELNRYKETAFVAILNSKKLSNEEKEYRYFKILDINEKNIKYYLTRVLNQIGKIENNDSLILTLKFLIKKNPEYVIKNFMDKSIKQGIITNPCNKDTILSTLMETFLSVFDIKDNKYLSKFFEKYGELNMMEIIDYLIDNLKNKLILNESLVEYPDIYIDKKKLYEQYKASLLGSLCDFEYREALVDNALEFIIQNLNLVLSYKTEYLDDFKHEITDKLKCDFKAMFVRNKINNAIACARHSNIMKSYYEMLLRKEFSQVYFSLNIKNYDNKGLISQIKYKIMDFLENPFEYSKDDARRINISEEDMKIWI